MLTWDAPLPARPRRVLVAGPSGVGKTTLAARIAGVIGAGHTEIDALFHGPDWTPRTDFLPDVERFSAEPTWVTEWQYGNVRPLLARRADLLVWLDLPFWRVTFPQVVSRTLRRRLRRERLWNGNVEPPLHTIFTDPEHIVRWSVSTRHLYRERIPLAAAANPGLTVVRIRSRRQLKAWLAESLANAVGR
jgi:adenylate kinase family enzyme